MGDRARGVLKTGEGFFIIECRRKPKRRLPQAHVGGLAFRIKDTGAAGGIIVSPLLLQRGARLVAASEVIHKVELSPESTTTDFVFRFLEHTLHGVSHGMRGDLHLGVDATLVRASK